MRQSVTELREAIRTVQASGEDQPLIWYEGSAVSSATRRSLQADYQGSIQSVADASGNVIGINRYDEYGVPATDNIGTFQYTGQVWLPEVGLYYYRARMYNPRLGRFMQTDPIGYKDDLDLYAYVGNDPIDGTDPSGFCDDKFNQNCQDLKNAQQSQQQQNTQPHTIKVEQVAGQDGNQFGHVVVAVDGKTPVGFGPVKGLTKIQILEEMVDPNANSPGRVETVATSAKILKQTMAIISAREALGAQVYIQMRIEHPGNYQLLYRNCADFAEKVLRAAGIPAPADITPGQLLDDLRADRGK